MPIPQAAAPAPAPTAPTNQNATLTRANEKSPRQGALLVYTGQGDSLFVPYGVAEWGKETVPLSHSAPDKRPGVVKKPASHGKPGQAVKLAALASAPDRSRSTRSRTRTPAKRRDPSPSEARCGNAPTSKEGCVTSSFSSTSRYASKTPSSCAASGTSSLFFGSSELDFSLLIFSELALFDDIASPFGLPCRKRLRAPCRAMPAHPLHFK